MKKSPKQKIMELAGGQVSGKWYKNAVAYKEKVLDQVVDVLDRREDEDVTDLKARLLGGGRGMSSISNSKLLKLHRVGTRLKNEFDGKKSNVVDQLVNARKGASGKEDAGYRTHLEKKSIATLFLLFDHAKKDGAIK